MSSRDKKKCRFGIGESRKSKFFSDQWTVVIEEFKFKPVCVATHMCVCKTFHFQCTKKLRNLEKAIDCMTELVGHHAYLFPIES